MKKLCALILFTTFTVMVYSSSVGYQLRGKIINSIGIPVPFASVAVLNTMAGTTTDEQGNFTLAFKSQPGHAVLVISSIGFKKKSINIELGSNLTIQLKEVLEEDVAHIEEVVVSAESISSSIERQGFNVSSIEIKTVGMQSVDLNKLLDQTAGVRVRQLGGLGSESNININGLSGSAVRIFINGVPMEYFGASYSLSSLPVSLVERIDVYKGVVPIELGNDALGGAINIVTKNTTEKKISASYSFGSFNTHTGSASMNTRHSKTGLSTQTSVFYNHSNNDYPVWSSDVILINDDRNSSDFGSISRGIKAKRFHDAYQSYGADVKVGLADKKWADAIFIGVNTSKMDKDHQHGATMMVPYGERRSNDKMSMPNITYKKKDFLTKGMDINALASYTYRNRQLIDTTLNTYNWLGNIVDIPNPTAGEGNGATLNSNTNKTYMGRFFISYQATDNITLGINYMYTNFNRSSDDPLSIPAVRLYGTEYRIRKHIIGTSIQSRAFDNKLTTSAFVKYYGNDVGIKKAEYNATDKSITPYSYDNYSDHYGYGLTGIYAITPTIRLSASAEKAVRLPGPNEIFGNVADDIVANNTLKPEQSNNLNLGVIVGPTHYGLHRMDLTLNLFYRNTKDKLKQILGESGGEKNMYVYKNLGKTLSKGADLTIEYAYNNILKTSTYISYLDSRFKDEFDQYGNRYLHFNAREPNSPYFTTGGHASYTWENPLNANGSLSFSWSANYVHEFFLKWETYGSQAKAVIPSQFINDCGMAYHFKNQNITLSIDGKNLFNKLAFDYYAIQKPGRAVYAKISFQL